MSFFIAIDNDVQERSEDDLSIIRSMTIGLGTITGMLHPGDGFLYTASWSTHRTSDGYRDLVDDGFVRKIDLATEQVVLQTKIYTDPEFDVFDFGLIVAGPGAHTANGFVDFTLYVGAKTGISRSEDGLNEVGVRSAVHRLNPETLEQIPPPFIWNMGSGASLTLGSGDEMVADTDALYHGLGGRDSSVAKVDYLTMYPTHEVFFGFGGDDGKIIHTPNDPDHIYIFADLKIEKLRRSDLVSVATSPQINPRTVSAKSKGPNLISSQSGDFRLLSKADLTQVGGAVSSGLGSEQFMYHNPETRRLFVSDFSNNRLQKVTEDLVVEMTVSTGSGFNGSVTAMAWLQPPPGTVGEPPTQIEIVPREEIFSAAYQDADTAPPKITALNDPTAIKQSLDTDVTFLGVGPQDYKVQVRVPPGGMNDLHLAQAYWVVADQPDLRTGKKLLLKGIRARSADPNARITLHFVG